MTAHDYPEPSEPLDPTDEDVPTPDLDALDEQLDDAPDDRED